MNGHQRRAEKKKQMILRSALALFEQYGISKVSMDEIAAEAGASKVTIYKYYTSKEDLYKEVMRMLYSGISDAVAQTINSDAGFIDKLKAVIFSKSESAKNLQGKFMQHVLENDAQMSAFIEEEFGGKIRSMMFRFFDQGREEGYIDAGVSNELLYLYINVFKAGLQGKASEMGLLAANPKALGQLVDMFFFGMVRKRD